MIAHAVTTSIFAWTALLVLVHLYALLRAWRSRPTVAGNQALPPVLLLRPAVGSDAALEDALASGRALPAGWHTRVLVGTAWDPAAATASAILGESCLRITQAPGPNHKAMQLQRALESPDAQRFDIVVVADGDVLLEEVTLRDLVGRCSNAAVGAAWAPPVEVTEPQTLGDRASMAVLTASLHAFPLLAEIDPKGMVGKLVAYRRDWLERIGGFGAFREVLGEDVAMACALRRAGARVERSHHVARCCPRGRSLSSVLQRFSRWMWVVRGQRHRLASYPLLLAGTLPALAALASLGAVAPALGEYTLAATLALLAMRMAARRAVRHRAGLGFDGSTALGDVVLADAALLAALAHNLHRRTFAWRGRRLRVAHGRLEDA